MFKIISAFCVLVLITNCLAQNDTNNVLLYAQNNFQTTVAIPFLPSCNNPAGNGTQIADDFKATSDWIIDQINIICMDLVTELVNGFNYNA